MHILTDKKFIQHSTSQKLEGIGCYSAIADANYEAKLHEEYDKQLQIKYYSTEAEYMQYEELKQEYEEAKQKFKEYEHYLLSKADSIRLQSVNSFKYLT